MASKNRDYFNRVTEEIRSFTARKDINKNTLARFGRRWVRNLIRNFDLIPRAEGVQNLHGRFSGIPSIVLAAGPSLDGVLPHLPALRERFLLISVDTSYRAALNVGIAPDFLVVVDPQYWNARHLDGCSLDSTLLVSESSTYPSVFHQTFGGVFFCGSLFPLGQYVERAVGEKGKLGAGGSVSTTTWDFARLLGCAPLVCAGLDLGFPLLKTHFHGGFFEERMHTLSRRCDPAETMAYHLLRDASPHLVANNAGGATLTDQRLVVYKWWFENQLKIHPEAQTLNLSRHGIKIEGMKSEEIQRLLAFPVVREAIDEGLREIRQAEGNGIRDGMSTLAGSIADLSDELKELQSAASTGARAVDRLEVLLEEKRDPSAAISELEAVDGSISKLVTRDIAGFLMHSTARSILDRTASGPDEPAYREQTIGDSREIYTKLEEASAYHIELLGKALLRLH